MSSGRKRVIRRLEAMRPLRAKVDQSYMDSVKAMQEGKPVAWCMFNVWIGDVVLKAMDVVAVYPENYGAVCAAFGVAEKYLNLADSDGIPSHVCGYSRNCLGYTIRMMKELKGQIPPEAPLGGMGKPVLLLASSTACDPRYKWFQLLGRYMDVPIWTLDTPLPSTIEHIMDEKYCERLIMFVTKDLKEFVKFLERLLGKKMDWAKLDEIVNATIEMHKVWFEINELRKAVPCPMHSRDFWSSMPPAIFLLGNPKESVKLYQDLYKEVKYRVDNGIGAIPEEKYRLMFSEIPPWHSLGFFEDLAERGWNFVVESVSYHPPIPLEGLEKVEDPLERIVRHFYQSFVLGYVREAIKKGIKCQSFSAPYLIWARDYKVDGALFHPLISCRAATTHLYEARELLLNKFKVPSLVVEGDIVDLRVFNAEDALRKAEAFEETMQHYKDERKKAGLGW